MRYRPCGCYEPHYDGEYFNSMYCGECYEVNKLQENKVRKTKEETKMTKKTDELKIGFDWEPKEKEAKEKVLPTKPYGQLISYISLVDGKEKWGLYTHKKGNKYYAYFSDYGKGFLFERDIEDVVDIVVHPSEKKPRFKKGDTVVVTSMRPIDSIGHQEALGKELIVDGFGDTNDLYGNEYWLHDPSNDFMYYFNDCNLTLKEDPKELHEAQESANFAHVAVQGIINAHAIKEMEDSYESRLKQMGVTPKPIFTFDDFDLSVRRTWKKQDFKEAVSNAALGLTGEAGEVADLIKKGIYHGRGFQPSGCDLPDNGEIDPDDVKDELSDVLFYVSAMAQEFGFTLEDIAKHNREKLEKRFPEGFSTEASAQKKDRAYAKNSNVFN